MYHVPGPVSISQNNLVWRNQLWGNRFEISFFITVKRSLTLGDEINVFNIKSESGIKKNLLGVYLIQDTGSTKPSINVQYEKKR